MSETCMPLDLVICKAGALVEATAAAQLGDAHAGFSQSQQDNNYSSLNLLCFMFVILLVVDGLH